MQTHKGFLAALFDFSFSEFLTTRIIRFIYAVGVFLAALAALAVGFSMMDGGFFMKVTGLIAVPLAFLFFVALARVSLEMTIVLFRIAEHTRDISAQTKKEPAF